MGLIEGVVFVIVGCWYGWQCCVKLVVSVELFLLLDVGVFVVYQVFSVECEVGVWFCCEGGVKYVREVRQNVVLGIVEVEKVQWFFGIGGVEVMLFVLGVGCIDVVGVGCCWFQIVENGRVVVNEFGCFVVLF